MSHIELRTSDGLWHVHAGGAQIAQTTRAIELIEGNRAAVLYVPRDDVAMDLLEPSDRQTQCPYKGGAVYFSIVTPSGRLEDAVWSYESPKPPLDAIAGYLSFYSDRVIISRG